MVDISRFNTGKLSIDDRPLPFGKHEGKTPNQILDDDPQYLVWFYENVDGEYITKETYKHASIAADEIDQ